MSKLRLLITGAASGLGREIALRYAREGARIVVADVNQERGQETVAELEQLGAESFFAALDVREFSQFEALREQMIERWQGVDIVVNNAGVASGGTFDEVDLDTWDWMLGINLMGVVKGCKAFTPLFKQQGHGYFINIASMAGLLCPPDMAEYNVAKAGVIALSETLRSELHPYNIFTTVVCPSFFKTNLAESFRSTDSNSTKAIEALLETSDISAADIADQIYAAVQSQEFMLLPHKRARTAYAIKQADPDAAHKELLKISHSIYAKKNN